MGGRGSRPKMTKCDNGERGSKMSTFGVTYFLNGTYMIRQYLKCNISAIEHLNFIITDSS